MVWAIDVLSRRRDIQDRLRAELTSLKERSWSEIDRLHYLDNFVREVLRVYCPGKLHARRTAVMFLTVCSRLDT